MSVSFNDIPSALRYPGAYIEIDGSMAGLGGSIAAVLLVGQKLPAGTAPAGEITLLSSVHDAKKKAGAGSMLHKMAARYRAIDPVLDVYMLPYADNAAGVQATGSVQISAPATASGVLSLYIGGALVSVGVEKGERTEVAAKLVAAIAASTLDLPVTAGLLAVGSDTVVLTALHKGSCGNDIDLRLGLYGEPVPEGMSVTLTAMSGGVGDPAPGDLPTLIGQDWYNYIVLGMNDTATFAAWHTESVRRYKPPVQAGFRVVSAWRGDYASAVAKGDTANFEHICCMSLGVNPVTTWEAAAIVAAAACPKLRNSPVESLEGRVLTGLIGVAYHDWTQCNSLLYKGMSVLQKTRDGGCTIKRLISMYRYRPDGSADDAYLDINTVEVMERIRYEQRIGAIQRFTGTAAAKTNEGYAPGLRITTEDSVRAYLLSLYENFLMREMGWVQDYAYYKSTLVVEQDPQNPSRFNFVDTPVILSPYYILAGRAQFYKKQPSF